MSIPPSRALALTFFLVLLAAYPANATGPAPLAPPGDRTSAGAAATRPMPAASPPRDARELWDSLAPAERDAVKQFFRETNYVGLVQPDVLILLNEHQPADAIGLVVATYHLPRSRAATVVALTAFANDLPLPDGYAP